MNESKPLSGKRAFITGDCRGINLGVARQLRYAGTDIDVCGRIASKLQGAAQELRRTGARVAPRGTMAGMANVASLLKTEISRIARKEVRAGTLGLKKAAGIYRAEIATLKRRAQALELELRRLSKANAKAAPDQAQAQVQPAQKLRFSARGLASLRRRLGLSALDCGLLVGVSGQSIYNWEEGNARPQARYLSAIAALRTLGKKEAAAHLKSLR